MKEVPTVGLERFAMELLQAVGLQPGPAALSARALVLADRWSIGSRGVMRLP